MKASAAGSGFSVVDLVVLGILMDEPRNAYRLAQHVDQGQLGRLVKLSKPAIYKSCRRLAVAGSLIGRPVRETEAPEKVVYSVNATGKRHFRELMRHFSGHVSPFHFEFHSFIWNLHRLGRAEGLRMLEALRAELVELRRWLMAHEQNDMSRAAFGARVVVKQYRMVVTTLVQWIEETTDEYRHTSGGWK
jgi:DNA-binding PadR family transcriptional regulator